MNRKAARKQAHGKENRGLQHFGWRGTSEALPNVKEIGDNEDREYERLSGDQRGHPHRPAIGRLPGSGIFSHRDCGGAHTWSLFILAVRIFWMFEIPEGPAARDHRNLREVI